MMKKNMMMRRTMVNDNGDDDVDGKSLDNIKNRRHHQLSGRLRLKRPQPWPRVQRFL